MDNTCSPSVHICGIFFLRIVWDWTIISWKLGRQYAPRLFGNLFKDKQTREERTSVEAIDSASIQSRERYIPTLLCTPVSIDDWPHFFFLLILEKLSSLAETAQPSRSLDNRRITKIIVTRYNEPRNYKIETSPILINRIALHRALNS